MDISGTHYDVDDPAVFCRQLIGVGMHGPRAEAEAACVVGLSHSDRSVREAALTAIGHSGRVNRAISGELLRLAIAALDDPDLRGRAIRALDDVGMFVFGGTAWTAVPGVRDSPGR